MAVGWRIYRLGAWRCKITPILFHGATPVRQSVLKHILAPVVGLLWDVELQPLRISRSAQQTLNIACGLLLRLLLMLEFNDFLGSVALTFCSLGKEFLQLLKIIRSFSRSLHEFTKLVLVWLFVAAIRFVVKQQMGPFRLSLLIIFSRFPYFWYTDYWIHFCF